MDRAVLRPDTRRKPLRALGDFGHLPPSDRFSAASAEAREWFRHLSHGGSEETITVREACERYAKVNPDAAKRFPRYVYGDAIAKVKLQKVREHHVREWRERLAAMPALVTRSKVGEAVTRKRSPATVNRDMVAFRAALNMALKRGEVTNALAWKETLQPGEAKGRRNLYLDRDQRRALLAELPKFAAAFARGLCLLPLRPGALAALRAGDFDPRRNELAVDNDKAGEGRRILVAGDTAAMLKAQVKSKLTGAPLFARADGTLIELSEIRRVFVTDDMETHALSDIRLQISRGEFVSITGPSGCGKSTLMSILGTLDTPTAGRYLLDGTEVSLLKERERARLRSQQIGFVFQAFNLIGDLTIVENVEVPLTYRDDIDRASRRKMAIDALERVGMTHRAKHYPAQLSGGQQQRVAVARALVGKPSILLADEPTGNLDSKNGESVMQLLKELHKMGSTLCMVTHDPRYADWADRQVLMVVGKIIKGSDAVVGLQQGSNTTSKFEAA